MKNLIVVGLALVMVGCGGGKYYTSFPQETEINGENYHYRNSVQVNLPVTMFHATTNENWVDYCKTRLYAPKTDDQFIYPFQDCVREEKSQLTTMGSAASQFITPVITTSMYAGSLAYGLHQVGKGLGASGSTVNQSGGGANAENTTNSGNKTTNTSIKGDTNINSGNKNYIK